MAIRKSLKRKMYGTKKGNLWYLLVFQQNTDNQQKETIGKHRKIKVSYTGEFHKLHKIYKTFKNLIREMKPFFLFAKLLEMSNLKS